MQIIDKDSIWEKATDLIKGLRSVIAAYSAYTTEAASIEGNGILSREYKDQQLAGAKDRMTNRCNTFFEGMLENVDALEKTLLKNDKVCDFSDPEFLACLTLIQACDKPLSPETVTGIAEKFLGHRKALIALSEVAKDQNQQTFKDKIYPTEAGMARLRGQIEDMMLAFPESAMIIPAVRDGITDMAAANGVTLSEADLDLGAGYQDILNMQMRAAMGLSS